MYLEGNDSGRLRGNIWGALGRAYRQTTGFVDLTGVTIGAGGRGGLAMQRVQKLSPWFRLVQLATA